MFRVTADSLAAYLDFDPERGHRFLRFSFAGAEADITRAAEKLRTWRR